MRLSVQHWRSYNCHSIFTYKPSRPSHSTNGLKKNTKVFNVNYYYWLIKKHLLWTFILELANKGRSSRAMLAFYRRRKCKLLLKNIIFYSFYCLCCKYIFILTGVSVLIVLPASEFVCVAEASIVISRNTFTNISSFRFHIVLFTV